MTDQDPVETVFADQATQEQVTVASNVAIAENTYRLRFRCELLAQTVTPGQFVMVRLADFDDPLIGRPFALYDTVEGPGGQCDSIDIVYFVGGKLTRHLAKLTQGQKLIVWGPLGNGFAPQTTDHLIMVAGGIGQTPFLSLAKEHLGLRRYGTRRVAPVRRVSLCYGAKSASHLAGVADFESAGVHVSISTDDGSAGSHGQVTEVLRPILDTVDPQSCQIVCCGPEPMMEAISELGAAAGIRVQVSLETPMACGIGICFSCVAPIRDATGQWDYRRTCVEGPVFDATQVQWRPASH